jgi:predicted O-methyltransferase YrrM
MAENHDMIWDYALRHTTAEDEVLHCLYRETNLKTVYPHMLSGQLQGKLLEMISRMMSPSRILEIGTFTGYSAICLARGLRDGGLLHTIDINDELADLALNYFKLAGLEEKIIVHTGDACMLIPELKEVFDLVFIDGDKEQYSEYYKVAMDSLKTGGYILADNVLWGGKVLHPSGMMDKEARGILDFNETVMADPMVEKIFLPLRDGLYLIRKIGK